jgi:hypothetical protein
VTDHRAEALRLISDAECLPPSHLGRARRYTEAQVHATLAVLDALSARPAPVVTWADTGLEVSDPAVFPDPGPGAPATKPARRRTSSTKASPTPEGDTTP